MSELITLLNQLLRQKSVPVKRIDPKIKALANEMTQFIQLHQADEMRPIGLSACQLGELVRVIAFRRNPLSIDEDDIQVVINPELVYHKGGYLVNESCLSLPGKEFVKEINSQLEKQASLL